MRVWQGPAEKTWIGMNVSICLEGTVGNYAVVAAGVVVQKGGMLTKVFRMSDFAEQKE